MSWAPRRRPASWRKYLSQDEKDAIEELDRAAAQLDQQRRKVTAARIPIMQRASQRARAAAAKSGDPNA